MSGRKKCDVSKDITDCEWYEHFEGVFNRSYTQGNDFFLFEENNTGGENENLTELNRPTDPQQVR